MTPISPANDKRARLVDFVNHLDAQRTPPAMSIAPPPSAPSSSGSPEPSGSTGNSPGHRFVVATDWSSATMPLAALRGFATMFSPGDPVELAFATPHEPGNGDLACVSALFEGLPEGVDTAALQLESFAEACRVSCSAALIPTGDPDIDVPALADFFVLMHHAAVTRSPGDSTRGSLTGPLLAKQLKAFRSGEFRA